MGNESRAQFIREQWGNGNNGKCKEICNSIVVRFFALFMRITEHQQVPVTEKLHNKFEKVFFFFLSMLEHCSAAILVQYPPKHASKEHTA